MVAEISHYEKLFNRRAYDVWTIDEWQVVLAEFEIKKDTFLTLGFASHFVGHKFHLHDGAIETLLNQMKNAVGNGLIVRHPHTDMPYIPTETRSYYELIRADELDKWFESQNVEYRIQSNLNITKINRPEPYQPFQENVILKTNAVKHNKLNRNLLDPVIDKAIDQACNMELADVYLKLKELALNNEAPFTGDIENGSLVYTNDNDKIDKLTKEALGKRLIIRRNNAV